MFQITRPTPRERIIPVLLDELNQAGVPDKDITVLISLGTHRYITNQEIEECYSKEVVERIAVINHEWKKMRKFQKLS